VLGGTLVVLSSQLPLEAGGGGGGGAWRLAGAGPTAEAITAAVATVLPGST